MLQYKTDENKKGEEKDCQVLDSKQQNEASENIEIENETDPKSASGLHGDHNYISTRKNDDLESQRCSFHPDISSTNLKYDHNYPKQDCDLKSIKMENVLNEDILIGINSKFERHLGSSLDEVRTQKFSDLISSSKSERFSEDATKNCDIDVKNIVDEIIQRVCDIIHENGVSSNTELQRKSTEKITTPNSCTFSKHVSTSPLKRSIMFSDDKTEILKAKNRSKRLRMSLENFPVLLQNVTKVKLNPLNHDDSSEIIKRINGKLPPNDELRKDGQEERNSETQVFQNSNCIGIKDSQDISIQNRGIESHSTEIREKKNGELLPRDDQTKPKCNREIQIPQNSNLIEMKASDKTSNIWGEENSVLDQIDLAKTPEKIISVSPSQRCKVMVPRIDQRRLNNLKKNSTTSGSKNVSENAFNENLFTNTNYLDSIPISKLKNLLCEKKSKSPSNKSTKKITNKTNECVSENTATSNAVSHSSTNATVTTSGDKTLEKIKKGKCPVLPESLNKRKSKPVKLNFNDSKKQKTFLTHKRLRKIPENVVNKFIQIQQDDQSEIENDDSSKSDSASSNNAAKRKSDSCDVVIQKSERLQKIPGNQPIQIQQDKQLKNKKFVSSKSDSASSDNAAKRNADSYDITIQKSGRLGKIPENEVNKFIQIQLKNQLKNEKDDSSKSDSISSDNSGKKNADSIQKSERLQKIPKNIVNKFIRIQKDDQLKSDPDNAAKRKADSCDVMMKKKDSCDITVVNKSITKIKTSSSKRNTSDLKRSQTLSFPTRQRKKVRRLKNTRKSLAVGKLNGQSSGRKQRKGVPTKPSSGESENLGNSRLEISDLRDEKLCLLSQFHYDPKLDNIKMTLEPGVVTCCFCHLPANHLLGLGDLFGPYRPLAEEVLARHETVNEHLKLNPTEGMQDQAHSASGSPQVTINTDKSTCFLTARVEEDSTIVEGSTVKDITKAVEKSSHRLRTLSTIEHVLQSTNNVAWQRKQKLMPNIKKNTTLRIPGPKNECRLVPDREFNPDSENGSQKSHNESVVPNINSIVFLEPNINMPHDVSNMRSPRTNQSSPQDVRPESSRRSTETRVKMSPGSQKFTETPEKVNDDSTCVCISHGFSTAPLWVHGNCAVWADGVYAIRGQLYGLWDAARMSNQILCNFCKRSGATIASRQDSINTKVNNVPLKAFHYPCSIAVGLKLNWETLTAER